MARPIALGTLAVALSACGPSPAPSVTSGPPVVECLGALDPATCDQALPAVLDAIAPSGWTPTTVWLNDGVLAPSEDLLFDPSANFPDPSLPGLGAPIASAEVAFVGTDKHAGVNLYRSGTGLAAHLVGYAVPHAGWCSGACPSGSTTDGPFRLELVLPHLDWKADQPITGTAILSYDGPAPITIYGSGSVLNFAYAEVGGNRTVGPVWTSDCASHALDPATPINAALGKSGAVSGSDPIYEFRRSFLAGPDVRLPTGTWDVSALAIFMDGEGCSGGPHSMTTTVQIMVNE